MAIVIGFIFAVKRRTNSLVKLYHESNIQAVDYTMYLPLTASQSAEFDRIYRQSNREKSRGQMMADLVIEHLDKTTKHSSVGGTDHSHNTQVSRVDLVFDNNKMLNLLINRGFAIKCKNKEDIQRIEKEIIDFKREHYYARIVGVFITYESWQDVKCITFASHSHEKFFGKHTCV